MDSAIQPANPSEEERQVATVQFAGRQFQLDLVGGADAVAASMQAGGYEAPLPMLFSALVARTEGLVLDVGANNGVYSLIAAVTKPEQHVVAFEPFLPVLEVLRRNVAINDLESRISVVPCALSNEDGEATIFVPDASHLLLETSSSLESDFISSSQPSAAVVTRRLDSMELIHPISVVKVDIEGHEFAFLEGATRTLTRDRPILFAEMLSAAERRFAYINSLLANLGYVSFRLRPDMAICSHGIKFDQQAWNHALIPQEKLPLFRDACYTHGVELLATF